MNKVYIKSNNAIKEFEQGNRSLSLKHRQLLIMVDGRRTDGEIAKIFNSQNVIEMLVDLLKLGFIVDIHETKSSAKNNHHDVNVTKAKDSLSSEHIALVKTFLIEEAQMQLGLMSRDIEQKVNLVQNTNDLKSAISRWHMAIRDSRNGRTVADKLMERLAHIMANPPQPIVLKQAA